MSINFNNSFVVGLGNKFATRLLLYFPLHKSMSLHYLAKLLLQTHSNFIKLLMVFAVMPKTRLEWHIF